uniref:Uncharacterized protein n=2 Tax=Heterorhabditis bacteriophora TaxID=37862 RepID=A0A1I7XBN2_HETBA
MEPTISLPSPQPPQPLFRTPGGLLNDKENMPKSGANRKRSHSAPNSHTFLKTLPTPPLHHNANESYVANVVDDHCLRCVLDKRQFNRLDYQSEQLFVNRLHPQYRYYDSREISTKFPEQHEYLFNKRILPPQRFYSPPRVQKEFNQNYILSGWNLNTQRPYTFDEQFSTGNPSVEYPDKFYKTYGLSPFISSSYTRPPMLVDKKAFAPQIITLDITSPLTAYDVTGPLVLASKKIKSINSDGSRISTQPYIFGEKEKYMSNSSKKYMTPTVVEQSPGLNRLFVGGTNIEDRKTLETITQQPIQKLSTNSLIGESVEEKFIQMAVQEDVKSTEYNSGKPLTIASNITQESSTTQSLLEFTVPSNYSNSKMQNPENHLSATVFNSRNFGMRAPPLPKEVFNKIHELGHLVDN